MIKLNVNLIEYKEPKKHNHNFCIDCNMVKTIDYQKSTLVCMKCGLCEYYPIYVTSYNHTMQPSRRKCTYKRSDNFKVILNQFFYGGKQFLPDDVMEAISTVAHKGQCNKKWFAANKKDMMQTKKIGWKQKRSNANKKDRMQTKKIGCKQKR